MSDGQERVGRVPEAERLRRWRLVLGGGEADGTGGRRSRRRRPDRRRARGASTTPAPQRPTAGGTTVGGRARPSAPSVARWLGDIRRYFPTPVVQVLQRDAIERLDLRQLLLEPELLEAVEPDLHLVGTAASSSTSCCPTRPGDGPPGRRQGARRARAPLADRTRQAVARCARRGRRTRRPRPADIDWLRTIRANLRHYQPEHRTVVPERLVGFGAAGSSLPAKDVIVPSTSPARWPTASSTPRCSARCWPRCRRCARLVVLRHRGRRPHRRCSPTRSTCCSASSSAAAPTPGRRRSRHRAVPAGAQRRGAVHDRLMAADLADLGRR